MKSLKKAIIILIVLSIIIFICILILNKKSQRDEFEITEVDRTQDFIKEMGLVSDYGSFSSVEEMLNNYIKYVASNNEEAIYSLLDNIFIEEHSITKNNVLKQISNITGDADKVRIRKMYGEKNEENGIYYINCILEKDGVGEEAYFVLYEDIKNLTYSIAHISKEKYEKKIKIKNEEIEAKQIEQNKYNKAVAEFPSEEERVNKYFEDFLGNAIYYTEYTYSILDEEYKNKRFPTLQDFEEYIEDKKEIYSAAIEEKTYNDFNTMDEYILYIAEKQRLQLQGYQIRNEEGYTRYICMDNYNNYYIFYATSPLNYTLMLDSYTLDLPEFTEKYELATTEEKVGYNIQKIVEALNGKDYNYIYSKLADEFKANYFKTYEDFERYAENTFDIGNEVTYNQYTESENYCTYKITLKGKSKTVTKTIVMKLEEGTDFVMSFNVN